MMRRGAWVYILIGSFAGGVFLRSFFDFGFSFIALFLLLGAVFLALSYARAARRTVLVGLTLFAFAFGVARFEIASLSHHETALQSYVGEHINAEGVVIDEPDKREQHVGLTVALDSVAGATVKSTVLVRTERFPETAYGDRISIVGTVEKPSLFENEQGKAVDYPSMLAAQGIFYVIPFAEIEIRSSGHGNPVKRSLFAVKRTFLSSLERILPEPESALLGGLVVGAKQSLGDELLEAFRTTGIVHIVVLSGYNVTIVAEALMRAFSFLPMLWGVGIGAGAIVLFAVMTGASATIVRASIMALLILLARVIKRPYVITRALFLTGFVMVLHNPYILAFDPSFQLSFLATLGLIVLAPLLEERLSLVPTVLQAREFVTATLATQLFVLPLLLYYTGELSLVALPVNVLILAFVPVTMLLGFITGVIGMVSVVAALPFAFLTYVFLAYALLVVDLFSQLPFAAVHVPSFPFWATVFMYAFYAALAFMVWLKRKKPADLTIPV